VHGRRFLSCAAAPSGTELYTLYHVHGGNEHPKCDCGRINLKLYGDWAAGGSDILGQYAVVGESGSVRPRMVDDIDARTFFGGDPCLSHESGESSEKMCEQKA